MHCACTAALQARHHLPHSRTNLPTYSLTGAAALVLKPGIIGGAPPGKLVRYRLLTYQLTNLLTYSRTHVLTYSRTNLSRAYVTMRAPPRRDPPGPPGMAPVSVEAVAAAAVAGALGKKSGSVDGNAAIAASA